MKNIFETRLKIFASDPPPMPSTHKALSDDLMHREITRKYLEGEIPIAAYQAMVEIVPPINLIKTALDVKY